MKAITNYINNSILMFLHYQHLTMLPLPRLPSPCKWQIFHFYLRYSCKWLGTVTFPLFWQIWAHCWSSQWMDRKVGWESWSALAGSIWVVVGGGKPEPWLENPQTVKLWAWETWIPRCPYSSLVELPQRNHLASLSLSFLIIANGMIVTLPPRAVLESKCETVKHHLVKLA